MFLVQDINAQQISVIKDQKSIQNYLIQLFKFFLKF